MEVVASLSQGRTATAQCGLFTHKSIPVIFEPPCTLVKFKNDAISFFKSDVYSYPLPSVRREQLGSTWTELGEILF